VTLPEPGPAARWRTDGERAGPVRFVAPGDVVDGDFGLFENTALPGQPGAMPHLHRTFSESFYVLSGRLAVLGGRQWRVGSSGDFVYVPPGGVHGFRAVGDEPARFLILFVPGAPRERYFRGLAEFAQRAEPPSPEEVDAFALSCDQLNLREWVHDPLPEP
jgi:mannose-6-phosphate isomerase-like protein (cupin superfamily)